MFDYPAARAVFLVVQTGSFDGAAQALGVTPSAVSQRVRGLEERMGVVLVERGTPCTATDEGAWLCRHMEQVGMLERGLMDHFPRMQDQGAATPVTLHLATNADSLETWFLSAVARVARESGYLLHISVDDEQHTADWLRRGRVIAAVTALGKPVQGCQMKALGRLRYHAVASPDFIRRHFPDGVTPAALKAAPALTFNQKDRLQQNWVQQQFGRSIAFPTHWLPSTNGFVTAALAGMGWCLNPPQLIAGHLASGQLVELIPDAVLDVPLFWQTNRLAADSLAPLTRAILSRSKEVLH
ncbi:LysR family transcriptional regulator ArgP [Paracoccus aestuariivivens]|uniref:ArgP/LysG family DNA-binding transcriptional regulator n=1 Tax=Paracoccus aestuariivivens TaxID=1820333 RepID=A0A6L6JCR8_9RHOB|nr:LysR family transcriptional regulator ArgP [Paracoccus aestuariivivens]MTH78529.1 ArgP/LysG family DNA-binding transcriptional regulator [Paracoccus aestuariivivens]